jgi:hypothetical protein
MTLLKMYENFGTKLFQLLRWSFLTGFTVLEFHDILSQMKIKLFTKLHYWQQMIGLMPKRIKI